MIGTTGALAVLEAAHGHPRLHTISLGYTRSTRILGSATNALGDKGAFAFATFLPCAKNLRRLDLRAMASPSAGLPRWSKHWSITTLQLNGKPNPKLAELPERNQAQSLLSTRDPAVALIRSVYRASASKFVSHLHWHP